MPDEKTTPEQRRKLQLDKELDDELEQTFPASDALTITQSGSLPPRPEPGRDEDRGPSGS